MTLRELLNTYFSIHARLHCRTWQNMERMASLYLFQWFDKDAARLKRFDVIALHSKLGAEISPTTANRVIEFLSCVYNKAIELELLTANPARGIKKFRLESRSRFLDRDEIRRLFEALQTLRYPVTRDFLLMCLFTGARRSNVAAMRWDEVSIEQRLWIIPRTKNGTGQVLPLTAEAMAVLCRRRADTPDSIPWVFPSHRSKSGHLTKPEAAWGEVLQRAGLQNARIHDLRRTLASWEALTGANLSVIAATLNHKNLKSTQIYARLNVDVVRQAMEKATDSMFRQ